jgi:uncharacterized membrane protein
MKDALYEAGRVSDVFLFGANEVLKDDGQIFSCDLTHHGKKRRVFTQRAPLLGVITAITPFNHPANQVAHKVVPSVATNNRMVLKPSEKVPFSAILFADILYEAGLPPEMLSVLTGDPREIADELLTNPQVDLITFTGGVAIGKYIAGKAGYRRMVLELGGNDPIIVMEDADIDEASTLAVTGSYKNSGQRCTAIKRMLVHEAVADRFVDQVVAKTRAWTYGDPGDKTMDMGTVIDEPAAKFFESRVNEAIAQGAKLLVGNQRRGALYSPTVVDQVPPEMLLVKEETFGPVSPIIRFKRHRRGDPDLQRHRLRAVQRRLHQPARLHHALCQRTGGRHRQRARSTRLPARAHPLRRHQGLGPGLQGRRAGGDEELHQPQDLFPALGLTRCRRSRPPVRRAAAQHTMALTWPVVAAVLFGALLHAGWNALVKSSSDKSLDTALIHLLGSVVAIPARGACRLATCRCMAVSRGVAGDSRGLLHGTCRRLPPRRPRADLSPDARHGPAAGGPVGDRHAGEHLTPLAWVGVMAVSAGVLVLGLSKHAFEAPKAVRFALVNAVIIALYTVVDALGVRASGHALQYVATLFLLDGWPFALIVFLQRRTEFMPYARKRWPVALGGAIASLGSYGIALWAMTQAPVAIVAALRETSVLFAALLGVWLLKEVMTLRRVIGTCAILAGVMALRLA